MLNYYYELNICCVKKNKRTIEWCTNAAGAWKGRDVFYAWEPSQRGWSTQDGAFENASVALALAASLSLQDVA